MSAAPKAGDKVTLARPVDRSPDFIAPAGLTGKIDEFSPGDAISVILDAPLAGAEDWDNTVVWAGDETAEFFDDIGIAKPAEPRNFDTYAVLAEIATALGITLLMPKVFEPHPATEENDEIEISETIHVEVGADYLVCYHCIDEAACKFNVWDERSTVAEVIEDVRAALREDAELKARRVN